MKFKCLVWNWRVALLVALVSTSLSLPVLTACNSPGEQPGLTPTVAAGPQMGASPAAGSGTVIMIPFSAIKAPVGQFRATGKTVTVACGHMQYYSRIADREVLLKGQKFIAVSCAVGNGRDQILRVSAANFSLIDFDGKVYPVDSTTSQFQPSFPSMDLAPGGSTTGGALSFLTPVAALPAVVVWSDDSERVSVTLPATESH